MRPYYEADGITIYHGDCREVLQGLRADAVVTDPPYGTEGEAGGYGRRELREAADRKGYTIQGDTDLTVWRDAALRLASVVARPAWLCAFCSPRRRFEHDGILAAAGWSLVGEAIWLKGQPGLGYTVRYGHETVVVASMGKPPVLQPLLSVLRGKVTARAMALRHPHEKPVDVLQSLVTFTTFVGGTVLDPFAGSGGTLMAAKAVGRRAIGIEIEERYCEIAAKRLAQGVLDFGGVA